MAPFHFFGQLSIEHSLYAKAWAKHEREGGQSCVACPCVPFFVGPSAAQLQAVRTSKVEASLWNLQHQICSLFFSAVPVEKDLLPLLTLQSKRKIELYIFSLCSFVSEAFVPLF